RSGSGRSGGEPDGGTDRDLLAIQYWQRTVGTEPVCERNQCAAGGASGVGITCTGAERFGRLGNGGDRGAGVEPVDRAHRRLPRLSQTICGDSPKDATIGTCHLSDLSEEGSAHDPAPLLPTPRSPHSVTVLCSDATSTAGLLTIASTLLRGVTDAGSESSVPCGKRGFCSVPSSLSNGLFIGGLRVSAVVALCFSKPFPTDKLHLPRPSALS